MLNEEPPSPPFKLSSVNSPTRWFRARPACRKLLHKNPQLRGSAGILLSDVGGGLEEVGLNHPEHGKFFPVSLFLAHNGSFIGLVHVRCGVRFDGVDWSFLRRAHV
jgi:hypothetical protein